MCVCICICVCVCMCMCVFGVDWDDVDDGTWEAPMIPNPICRVSRGRVLGLSVCSLGLDLWDACLVVCVFSYCFVVVSVM